MNALLPHHAPPPTPAPTPAGELLDAMGLTLTLPERLLHDETGQRFEPPQLQPDRAPVQLLGFLMRREPVGGAELLIQENQRQVHAQLPVQLNRAFGSANVAPRALLQELLTEVRRRKDQLDARYQQHDQTYTRTQARLHTWQQHAANGSGGIGRGLVRLIFGGDARLTLPEVIALWNQREYQALQRMTWAAARDVATACLEIVTDLLNRLDDLLDQAHQYATHLEQSAPPAQRPAAPAGSWSVSIDAEVVTEALAETRHHEGLGGDLLQRLAAMTETETLADHVQELARQEAERCLAPLSIIDLIELEARAGAHAHAADPLVLLGQAHLEALQRPTWQVCRTARPRVETLQITPDGTPIYSLDGLGSAAYGASPDRLGFVQVQFGVALDELTLLRDGDAAFQAALQQRNLYVLEEMARAWTTATSEREDRRCTGFTAANGTHDVAASATDPTMADGAGPVSG